MLSLFLCLFTTFYLMCYFHFNFLYTENAKWKMQNGKCKMENRNKMEIKINIYKY